jgi:hypothetical protein
MRALVDRFGWKPLDTAPFDQDATLMVSDGRGTTYALKSPFRLTVAGRVSASKGTPLSVTPLQWKRYFPYLTDDRPPLPAALARRQVARAAMSSVTPAGRARR